MNVGQKFARFATDSVVRRPGTWRLFRGPIRRMFDKIAPSWDAMRSSGHQESLTGALEAIPEAPARVLDIGTGTGTAARAIALRWPGADVVGVDVSEQMIAEARRLTPPELAERLRFDLVDASALPFDGGSFELVMLSNMIPFFDEIDRVLAPGGHVAFVWSVGVDTPIYVPPERLPSALEKRGFGEFRELDAPPGTAFVARKAQAG